MSTAWVGGPVDQRMFESVLDGWPFYPHWGPGRMQILVQGRWWHPHYRKRVPTLLWDGGVRVHSGGEKDEVGLRRWLRLPPTSTIRHSVPLSRPAVTSISKRYSATPTVLSRAFSTSSVKKEWQWRQYAFVTISEGGVKLTVRRHEPKRGNTVEIIQETSQRNESPER